jgi:hypothetical protein
MTVAEAENYRAEKESIVQNVKARSDFELYVYSLRNTMRVSLSAKILPI